MEKLKIAIIGTGLIGGGEHARIYTEMNNAEVVAVCDIKVERAKEIAAKYGATKWYRDYQEMLKDDEVDFQAVSVCTPDFAHRDPVVASLEAGKHVLVEKPFATSLADAKEMVKAAERTGNKLMVKYLSRWNPQQEWMKRAIDDGEIGEPLWGRAVATDTIYVPREYLNWVDRSSATWFLSCYHMDVLGWYINSTVKEVYARGRRKVLKSMGINTWDGIQAQLTFDNGFVFNDEASWIRPDSFPRIVDRFFEIVGSEGTIWFDNRYETPHVYKQDGARFAFLGGIHEVAGKLRGPVQLAIEHFVDCVLNDKNPWTPGSEGAKHVEVLEAIHRSAESGEIIKLPLEE
jgi:predicted dehydrogenase